MRMNAYNLIWADDEIDILLSDIKRDILKSEGFEVISKAHTGEELETHLKSYENQVDAVIVDANFSLKSTVVDKETTTSGLNRAWALYKHEYGERIPFFIYTGRTEELLKEVYEDRDEMEILNDFPRHKRLFSKTLDEWPEMLEEIKKTIEDMRSPNFQIRNKYSEELNAAESISPDVKSKIFDLLKDELSDEEETQEERFNQLRSIFEIIVKKCVINKILPQLSQLNSLTTFLKKEEVEGFQLTKSIMPRALVLSLEYFLNIVQEGSHEGTAHKVKEYVRRRNNNNLVKSVLYILLDLILWYKERLEIQKADEAEILWTSPNPIVGKVQAKILEDRTIWIMNNEYQIQDKEDHVLFDQCEIEVIKATKNTKPPFDGIKYFVYRDKYRIISSSGDSFTGQCNDLDNTCRDMQSCDHQ